MPVDEQWQDEPSILLVKDLFFDTSHLDLYSDHPSALSARDVLYHNQLERLVPKAPTQEDNLNLTNQIQSGKAADTELAADLELKASGDPGFLEENQISEYKRLANEADEARETLIVNGLRLAAWLVRQTMDLDKSQRLAKGKDGQPGMILPDLTILKGCNLDYDDRMQVATVGLIRAVNTYTGYTTKGEAVKFSTWVLYNMENDLIRALDKAAAPLKLPQAIVRELRELYKFQELLSQDGQDPEPVLYEDLARELDESIEETIDLVEIRDRANIVSYEVLELFVASVAVNGTDLNYVDENGESLSISDMLADPNSTMSVEDEAIEGLSEHSVKADLDEIIYPLIDPIRQRQVVRQHADGMSFKAISQELGISKSRADQINTAAIKGLRQRTKALSKVEDYYYRGEKDPMYGQRAEVKLKRALGNNQPEFRSNGSIKISRYMGAGTDSES